MSVAGQLMTIEYVLLHVALLMGCCVCSMTFILVIIIS